MMKDQELEFEELLEDMTPAELREEINFTRLTISRKQLDIQELEMETRMWVRKEMALLEHAEENGVDVN